MRLISGCDSPEVSGNPFRSSRCWSASCAFPPAASARQDFVFFCRTLNRVSSDGVAVPITIGISFFLGAEYGQITGVITPAVLLFMEPSCSSSIIMMPREVNGVNSAERVPITMAVSPRFCLQPDSQPFAVIHAGMENIHRCLKTGAKTGDGLGVRPISGTSTEGLAAFGQHIFQHTEIHFRFPEPVTPSSSRGEKLMLLCADRPTAVACSVLSFRRSPVTANPAAGFALRLDIVQE